MAYQSVAQQDSIDSVHQSSTFFFNLVYTGLQPSGTVLVIRSPVHRKHRLNSIRAKMKNDNENEKVHDLLSE